MTTLAATAPTTPDIRGGTLAGAVGAAWIGAVAVLALLLTLVNRADYWLGLRAAAVVALLAGSLSLAVLLWAIRGSAHRVLAGFMASIAVRGAATLGAGLVAVKLGHYPMWPTFLLTIPLYFAILAAEVAVIGKGLWNAKV